jgi:hypothetical protein
MCACAPLVCSFSSGLYLRPCRSRLACSFGIFAFRMSARTPQGIVKIDQ